MVVMLINDFRGQLKALAVWAVVHGLLIVGLMHWRLPFALWSVCMLIELTLGLVLAGYLFGIRPTSGERLSGKVPDAERTSEVAPLITS
jgi:hypothetical protein